MIAILLQTLEKDHFFNSDMRLVVKFLRWNPSPLRLRGTLRRMVYMRALSVFAVKADKGIVESLGIALSQRIKIFLQTENTGLGITSKLFTNASRIET